MEPVQSPLPSSESQPAPGELRPWTKPTCERESLKDAMTSAFGFSTNDAITCS